MDHCRAPQQQRPRRPFRFEKEEPWFQCACAFPAIHRGSGYPPILRADSTLGIAEKLRVRGRNEVPFEWCVVIVTPRGRYTDEKNKLLHSELFSASAIPKPLLFLKRTAIGIINSSRAGNRHVGRESTQKEEEEKRTTLLAERSFADKIKFANGRECQGTV